MNCVGAVVLLPLAMRIPSFRRVTVMVYVVLVSVERHFVHIPPKELGQTFGIAIMTTRDRSNNAVEKNAGDLRCGIDMELSRKNGRQYSGQRQSKPFCKTRLGALPADDAGSENRQRFEANELDVSLDLALGLRIEE
jgi:hypothetical protein